MGHRVRKFYTTLCFVAGKPSEAAVLLGRYVFCWRSDMSRNGGLVMLKRASKFVLVLALACWGAIAHASIILHYQGNTFTDTDLLGPTTPADLYTTSDSATGWIELSSVLAANLNFATVTPLSFSFTDGVNTIDDSNVTLSLFTFETDASGVIVGWGINLGRSFESSGTWFDQQIVTSSGALNPVTVETIDFGVDILCGPGSSSLGCVIGGDPHYIQDGLVRDAPGAWSYQVPAPATVALFGIGLAGLGWSKRQRSLPFRVRAL